MSASILHRYQTPFVKGVISVGSAIIICFSNAAAQSKDSKSQEQLKHFEKVLRAYPVSQSALKLNFLFCFPQEEALKADTGLWGARYMEIDENGTLYISDSRAHRILVFDHSGNFIRQIGKKGQAPGEFYSPRGIAYDGKCLIINDTGNHRFQFFSTSGKFINSFVVYKTYYEIAASNNGMIYAAPIRMLNSDPLVDVFNHEGKILFSFGVGKKHTNWQQLNLIKMSTSADNVFVGFQCFPVLRTYSVLGVLKNESNFGRGFMKEQEKMNISRDRKENPARIGFVNIIQDIKQNNGRALVLVSHPRVEILEFDNGGRLKSSWWAEKVFDCFDVALAYYSGSQNKRFYFLQEYPDNLVKAFDQAR